MAAYDESAEAAAEALEGWRYDGHEWIGARVRRSYEKTKAISVGTIRKWLPEDPATGDPPLWRAVHDDGDEEDLEEHEVKEAVEAYKNPKAVTFLNPGLSSALSSPAMSAAGRAAAPAAAAAPPRGERFSGRERKPVDNKWYVASEPPPPPPPKPAAPPPPSRADRYAGRAALAPPPAAAAAAPASAKKPKPSPAAEVKPRPSPARTTRHTRA